MHIRTLSELAQPDERSLLFTPLGLSMVGTLDPEDAAEFQQRVIAGADLGDGVPEATRAEFERLRDLHAYGLFDYDMYTIAYERAPLFLNLALRERFLAYYEGRVPLIKSDGTTDTLRVSSFEDVHEALNRGSHKKGGWSLDLGTDGSMTFKGGFGHLLEWARQVDLLHGQRNRRIEKSLVELRNRGAHPSSYRVVSPVDSARRIRDVAEIVNRLWGSLTPGGRLFPAPVRRRILAVGWDEEGEHLVQFRASAGHEPVHDSYTYILLLAVEEDSALWQYDSHFETTDFPVKLIWGPGPWTGAALWLLENRPECDEVEYLDRLFLIRTIDGRVDRPRRPQVALALSRAERAGIWHLIRADHPNAALRHVRGPGGNPDPDCASEGACSTCAADVVARGSWEEVSARLTGYRPEAPAKVRVPSLWALGW